MTADADGMGDDGGGDDGGDGHGDDSGPGDVSSITVLTLIGDCYNLC